MTPDLENLLREYDRAGYTISDQAYFLDVSTRTVQRLWARLGLQAPVVGYYGPEVKAEAETMLDEGCSFAETARSLGVAESTVQRWFPGRGWTQKQTAEHRGLLRRHKQLMEEA